MQSCDQSVRRRLSWVRSSNTRLYRRAVGFETLLQDAVLKVSKTDARVSSFHPECGRVDGRFQLQNAPALSEIHGVEAMLRLRLPYGLRVRNAGIYVGRRSARRNLGIRNERCGDHRQSSPVEGSSASPLCGSDLATPNL